MAQSGRESYSLLHISNPDVLLWSLKAAEDGLEKGLISRVWNLLSAPQQYTLSLTPGLTSATLTTHLETDMAALPVAATGVNARLEGSQIQTIRVSPRKAGQ